MSGTRRPVIAALIIALLAVASLAASCGGDDDVVAETTSSTTTTTVAATTTTTTSTTTTTIATTTTEVDLGPRYPLTGEPLGDADAPTGPALVMKVSNNNADSRRALIGLDHADIIYEERIESDATRFAVVFHSDVPEEIGPVRSARTSDIDIVANLNNPIFGYSGSNQGVASQLRTADGQGLLRRVTAETGASPFYRDRRFSAPDNMMVGGPEMLAQAPSDATGPEAIFDYSSTVAELGTPSAGVEIASRSVADYVWSEDDGGYLRFQSGSAHVTQDGVQITPTNVVVLTTTYLPSKIDRSSVDAQTIGSGPAVVYSQGYRVEGTWTRAVQRDAYTLETPDGQLIGLAPGQTWLALSPVGTSSELSQADADALR